jgi:hypothetical protein
MLLEQDGNAIDQCIQYTLHCKATNGHVVSVGTSGNARVYATWSTGSRGWGAPLMLTTFPDSDEAGA